jgi:hypothetical protein
LKLRADGRRGRGSWRAGGESGRGLKKQGFFFSKHNRVTAVIYISCDHDEEKMIPQSHGLREYYWPIEIHVLLLRNQIVESLDRRHESRLLARFKELEQSS